MKRILLTLSIVVLTSMVMAQQPRCFPIVGGGQPSSGDIQSAPLAACDNEKGYFDFPFTENGITVTASGTGTYTYWAPGFGSCGIFAKANCVYIGGNGPATFTNTFSSPVNDMIYNITATDSDFGGEVITITTDLGTPSITYTDGDCQSDWSIIGNVITCINETGIYGAGGRFLVHSTSDFSSITFSHNGVAAGSTMTMCFDQAIAPPSEVPVSNWALFIGIGLILVAAVIRFKRLF